jgi:hypothetical protein
MPYVTVGMVMHFATRSSSSDTELRPLVYCTQTQIKRCMPFRVSMISYLARINQLVFPVTETLFFYEAYPLAPSESYMGRTAQITSRRCILNTYSTNTRTKYFKHAAQSLFFSL